MDTLLSFYSVSLDFNIPAIDKNLNALKKFYGNDFNYTVVVPKKSVSLFNDLRIKHGITILDEDEILTIESFKSIVQSIRAKFEVECKCSVIVDSTRLGWYYQQILKLAYIIGCSKYHPITMIDGDTILLDKIKFYNSDSSILYSTFQEKHLPYWQTLKNIFGETISFDGWISTTCQINSLTPVESISLCESLNSYLEKKDDESLAEWLSRIVITSVLEVHGFIGESLISEQDFIGFFLRSYYKTMPKPLMFLRNGLRSPLSKKQESWARLFGIKHVTYESWNMSHCTSFVPPLELIFLIANQYRIHILRRLQLVFSPVKLV